MSVSSPAPATPGSPRPGLSPLSVSDTSSVEEKIPERRKTGSELIEEAFGGKLWPGNRRWHGVSSCKMALKRLSRSAPAGSTPSECLCHWGFKKNKATRVLFWLAENVKGRIIPVNLATKWIYGVNRSSSKYARKAAGEELNQTNRTGELDGVSLQYILVEANPSDLSEENELEFCKRTLEAIEEWLASRPVPENHFRFFHGTSTKYMNDIVIGGISMGRFQTVSDFGSGFYCADKVRTALRFAILTALELGEGRQSASLMYFDVDNDDLNELQQIHVEGDAWSEWTQKCLSEKELTHVYLGERRSGLQLVIGKLVHNPDKVELEGVTAEAFKDERKQYCFREKAGNLLLQNRTKMGVALFDVFLPPDEEDQH